jgi:hypothetical protein
LPEVGQEGSRIHYRDSSAGAGRKMGGIAGDEALTRKEGHTVQLLPALLGQPVENRLLIG